MFVHAARVKSGSGLTMTGIMVAVRMRHPHAFPEFLELRLESLVPLDQVLDGLVAVVLALELVQLALESLNVLLRPCPDGTLGLTIICPLPGQL